MSTQGKILVLCPNAWDKTAFSRFELKNGYQLVFDGEELLREPSLWKALTFDVFGYHRQLVKRHRKAGFDGVVGTGDYPGCMLAAGLAEELGLKAPRLKDLVDPFDLEGDPALGYPLFLKPVKGTMSIRAQQVRDRRELKQALKFTWAERLRGQLLLRPFQQWLGAYSDRRVPAHFFIAERPLQGQQVTVDGFIQDGQVTLMGIVDSVMYPGTISFQRFEYPSHLPAPVQARMAEVVERLIAGSGLDQSHFNVEMFYDPETSRISIIEINPRMSYQFADLYQRVDGMNTYDVQLSLALGRRAQWRRGEGADRAAASFVMRRFSDARILAVPSPQEIQRVKERYPGTLVQILCDAGRWLSSYDQDMGSFRYCIVNMSAPDLEELHARYREVEPALPFHFENEHCNRGSPRVS
jgi:biotin carboxylase